MLGLFGHIVTKLLLRTKDSPLWRLLCLPGISFIPLVRLLSHGCCSMIMSTSGRLKINFDRALFKDSGTAGAGDVVQNASGECVGWKSQIFHNVHSVDLAEALVARVAMEVSMMFMGMEM